MPVTIRGAATVTVSSRGLRLSAGYGGSRLRRPLAVASNLPLAGRQLRHGARSSATPN